MLRLLPCIAAARAATFGLRGDALVDGPLFTDWLTLDVGLTRYERAALVYVNGSLVTEMPASRRAAVAFYARI